MLEIRDLRAAYEERDVLHGISLDVGAGEFVCVIGANTAGKSTLLRAISGEVPRVTGHMTFDGHDLLGRKGNDMPGLGIAHVPEGRQVFPEMTVLENLRLGAYAIRKDKDRVASGFDRVFQLFPRLAERRTQLAGTMSGGEQQMVALGRAMMLGPTLLMLDEPSHGLAPLLVKEVYDTVAHVHSEGMGVLLVEQNVTMALSVAERGYVLESGKLVLSGSREELESNDDVRAAYLGI